MKKGWRLDAAWVNIYLDKQRYADSSRINNEMSENQRRIADDNAALIKIQRDHLEEHRHGQRPAENIGAGETKQ